MRRETIRLIRRLRATDWFVNVGQPIDGADVKRAYSWKEALAYTLCVDWRNLTLEAGHNDLTAQIVRSDRLAQLWKRSLGHLRPKVTEIVQERATQISREYDFPKGFSDSVQWCVLHACLEEEFRGKIEGHFNTDLISWYLKGHYPCGWDGKYPAGRLVVF